MEYDEKIAKAKRLGTISCIIIVVIILIAGYNGQQIKYNSSGIRIIRKEDLITYAIISLLSFAGTITGGIAFYFEEYHRKRTVIGLAINGLLALLVIFGFIKAFYYILCNS